MDKFILERDDFQQLIDGLHARGYQVIGPTLSSSAVTYDEIASTDDLPIGWMDEQAAGAYRLKRRPDAALFGYTASPQSWKRFLHPPEARLWQMERTGQGFRVVPEMTAPPRYAFVGVRACELAAIAIQDRVFLGGAYIDPIYQRNREGAFIVAVNCTHAGGTCFCASAGTGPQAVAGFDLALTEIIDDESHYFVGEVGTDAGAELLDSLPHHDASAAEIGRAEQAVAQAAKQMGRTIDLTNTQQKLYESYEHPRWEAVAERCLMCGNCTLVCPTCFCTTVEDVTDLSGDHAERHVKWDSCFTMDFSYIHGGSVRYSPKARYRQWLTHKLATWIDEFGTRGCVGCGRCITWCPAGIDIVAEAKAIQESRATKAQVEETP